MNYMARQVVHPGGAENSTLFPLLVSKPGLCSEISLELWPGCCGTPVVIVLGQSQAGFWPNSGEIWAKTQKPSQMEFYFHILTAPPPGELPPQPPQEGAYNSLQQ